MPQADAGMAVPRSRPHSATGYPGASRHPYMLRPESAPAIHPVNRPEPDAWPGLVPGTMAPARTAFIQQRRLREKHFAGCATGIGIPAPPAPAALPPVAGEGGSRRPAAPRATLVRTPTDSHAGLTPARGGKQNTAMAARRVRRCSP